VGSEKAKANLAKHSVSFEDALTVFSDALALIFDDDDHSTDEQREIIIGHSARERLLGVCFTSQGESVRIFSARKATRKEREDYEENVKP